jgi:hypothetical protein
MSESTGTRQRHGFAMPDATQPPLATIDHQGRRILVTCRIGFDGVEYVGRLFFAPEDGTDAPLPDRAAVPGRSRDEVLALAQRLSAHELIVRHRRALAEKRRYLRLRRATDEIIAKVRYMNQLAISMQAGVIDVDGANQEIELTERQIIDVVLQLKEYAGIEG